MSTHFHGRAERCHGLAILDRGHLVAEGAPATADRDIPAIVVEIEAADTVGARRALDGDPAVLSIAQRRRLHALVDPATPTADARLRGLLEQAGVAAQVEDHCAPASRTYSSPPPAFAPPQPRRRHNDGDAPTMLNRIAAVTIKELHQLSRDRPLAFGMIIGIPPVPGLLFGYAINFDVRGLPGAVVDAAQTSGSRA
ncbi:MAG: hypothetical protein R3E75_13040 [Steroidobacteraceae bacterium]